jgi:hypothetical protein
MFLTKSRTGQYLPDMGYGELNMSAYYWPQVFRDIAISFCRLNIFVGRSL